MRGFFVFLLTLALLPGCAAQTQRKADAAAPNRDLVLVVPGATGDGPWERGLVSSIREQGKRRVEVLSWGAPKPLFVLNLQTPAIHNAAQEKLAARIIEWRLSNPTGHLDVIAHSAGCGVTLGALQWIGDNRSVDNVILLRPSVSPAYDLAAPLQHVTGRLHVFYSDRDTLLLKWRTSAFGTYDNVRTQAAGRVGFTSAAQLPGNLQARCLQHPYNPAWKPLGDDGSHFGPLARPFAASVLTPLLAH